MFEYKITATDGRARIGEFQTPHGPIQTPVFMPVGTHGAVKSASPLELAKAGSQIILSNTYHLYLRPGDELIQKTGGLHAFMNWHGPILTDSGGFQVFSLGERGMAGNQKQPLRSVQEEGISFKSHLDGSNHSFTPEKSIQVQQNLGSDIMMAFDQPVYGMSESEKARDAMERSMRWLHRSYEQWQRGDTEKQALFGIVQGGTYTDLHQQSAREVANMDLPGNAIGGLSVGEGKKEMWEAVSSINHILPVEKPRYFMGLGEPLDLIQATLRGVDMYDCVAPSRLARHGVVWQLEGSEEAKQAFWQGDTERLLDMNLTVERWNLNNAKYREDTSSLQAYGTLLDSDLQGFSRASLHHFLKSHEMLGYRIMTLHNISVLTQITLHMRQAIQIGQLEKLAQVIS